MNFFMTQAGLPKPHDVSCEVILSTHFHWYFEMQTLFLLRFPLKCGLNVKCSLRTEVVTQDLHKMTPKVGVFLQMLDKLVISGFCKNGKTGTKVYYLCINVTENKIQNACINASSVRVTWQHFASAERLNRETKSTFTVWCSLALE